MELANYLKPRSGLKRLMPMTMKSRDNTVEHGQEEEREYGVKWRSLHHAALFLIGERLAVSGY